MTCSEPSTETTINSCIVHPKIVLVILVILAKITKNLVVTNAVNNELPVPHPSFLFDQYI